MSAKAAGKRKAVDNDDDDDDDDDSRYGESSSGTMKRFWSNASTQQMVMAPPPIPHPDFNATGVRIVVFFKVSYLIVPRLCACHPPPLYHPVVPTLRLAFPFISAITSQCSFR